jgi:hypothetical protein
MSGAHRPPVMANLGNGREMIEREFADGVDRASANRAENPGGKRGGLPPLERSSGTAGHLREW